MICDRQGLIGREMFAIDGVKLPSNASKAKSGKRKDFVRQAHKMQQAVEKLLRKHRDNDAAVPSQRLREREKRQIERLQAARPAQIDAVAGATSRRAQERQGQAAASPIVPTTSRPRWPPTKAWCKAIPGWPRSMRSTRSSSMRKPMGAARSKSCCRRLLDALEQLRAQHTIIRADSGYHSEANLKQLEAASIEAFIPDNGYRKRDARYEGQEQHRAKPDALWDKSEKATHKPRSCFGPRDFQVADDLSHLHLPGGQAAVSQRHELQHRGTARHPIQRHPARLRKMSAQSPVPTPPAAKQDQTGRHLRGQARQGSGESERAHEAQDRFATRTRDDRATVRHGRAGVWQPHEATRD